MARRTRARAGETISRVRARFPRGDRSKSLAVCSAEREEEEEVEDANKARELGKSRARSPVSSASSSRVARRGLAPDTNIPIRFYLSSAAPLSLSFALACFSFCLPGVSL